MATSKPTITTIQDTFTTLVTNQNTISLDLGATGRLTTNEDSDAVSAINELELGIRGLSNDLVALDLSQAGITANNIVSALVEHDIDMHGAGGGDAATDLTTTANCLVDAVNEIEAVFDASLYEITAESNQFDVWSGAFNVNAEGNISLDASTGNILFLDDSAQFGAITSTGTDIIIKSGTSTLLTGSGQNGIFNNNLLVENNLTVTGQTDLNGHVNLGNATADNISVVGRVDTNIVPDADDTYDLGDSSLQWRDIYIDGTAYIDNLDADSAEIGNINIAGDVIDANGDISLKSTTGDVILDANGGDVFFKDGGTTYGSVTNTSGNLIVKSGTTTGLTFSGANVTTGGNITVGGTKINRTGALTLDVSGNISLDADGGNVYLKDAGTTYGNLKNTSGQLVVQSGGQTAATFDSADVLFAGTVKVGSLNTTATDVRAAINEHEADLGNMSLNTSASNVTAAINEVHTELGTTVDSDGLNGNLASTNIGLSLYKLDSAIGDLDLLNGDGTISNRTNIVRSINSLADDISLLDSDSTLQNARLGSLVDLNAAFVGSERVNFVAALNALRVDVPLIFDENGTQLN